MFKIYHGCLLVNDGGTRKLIDFKCGEKCLCVTDKPFWKRPAECTVNGVQTRNMENKNRLKQASKAATLKFFEQQEKNHDPNLTKN